MKTAARWIAAAVLASGVTWAHGQAGDSATLQQKLNTEFKATQTTKDLSEIVTAGDVLELQKDGLRMSALATVLTESNTYKDGKIGGGAAKRAWGTFGTIMLAAAVAGLDTTGTATVPDGIPPRILKTGDRCWVLGTQVEKDGMVFKLYTDPDDNGVRYHATLKFPFPNKKHVPPVEEALGQIAEVLKVVPPEELAPPPEPAEAAETAPAAEAPPAEPQRQYEDVAPPPPPPDAAPPSPPARRPR